ncbi:MAG: MerR family transcriptional regulator [Candidatus Eremiobacteraeota bacterium]|nr:MerR family transcriptional regulator [Candidatus Eremiobacteraeota bacterium]MCW5868944.1 MerR family transcriptional regulator [Candidatus Eremiobacteraeota bacterium]
MNLTLSIDDRVIQKARQVAQSMGKSVNQLVRDYLEQLTALDEPQQDVEELRQLTAEGQGRSGGWKFRREEVYDLP